MTSHPRVTYTVKELAGLLQAGAHTSVARRASRESWQSRPRQGRGGGHEWLLESMPEATQLAIRLAEGKRALAISKANLPVPATSSVLSHTITTSEIAVLDDKRRYKALAKGDLLALYYDWQHKHGATVAQKDLFIEAYTGGAWSALLAELGEKISWKSLERWKNTQKRAGSVLALADRRGIAHRGKTSLTEQHRGLILSHILHPNALNVAQCARRVQSRCRAEGISEPSAQTIRRFVAAYMTECFDEWTLWREGKKAWNDKCSMSLLRDWSLVEVGDIVIADGHTLNFETINPVTGKAKRMTLLLFYDGASAHPLGWEIMATENTACIASAFRRSCMTLGKIPRVVYIDNGKAFRSKFFEGTANFSEAGFAGLYKDLGCEVIHAWPYHGQSKTIERFFGSFLDMEVSMPSYVGNCIANKPARMHRGEPLHRQLYEKMGGRPLTMEETHIAIAMWFCEYASRPQPRTHLQGKTPAAVLQAGIGDGIDVGRLTLMMLQKEIRTISKDGIRHQGRLYWHEALISRRHPVLIRYDDQLSPQTVLVYDTNGTYLCEARDRAHYRIAAGLHPAARVLGTPEQVQDLSDAIELKRGQEKATAASLRKMLEMVVLPETKRLHETIIPALPAPSSPQKISAPAIKALSATEKAQVEAAKDQARTEVVAPYKPATLMRFKDELAKYDYLFNTLHEQNIDLVPQDTAWMATFEASAVYQRTCKGRYDGRLELYAFRGQRAC